MKKFYSLLAAVALTATINAQTTVAYSITGLNTTTGIVSTTSNPTDTNLTFKADQGASTANAPGYFPGTPNQLRLYSFRATGEGNTLTITPASGYVITSVTFTALTDKPVVTYNVAGGTTQTAAIVDAAYTLTNTAETAGPLTFKNAHNTGGTTGSNLQLRISGLTVTYKSATLAVGDATKGKSSLVKNTIVSNELIFGASSKVSVYNTAGQLVKSAEVAENSRLDVSALPKGTYVVTGLVNGQAVSQKVIKK